TEMPSQLRLERQYPMGLWCNVSFACQQTRFHEPTGEGDRDAIPAPVWNVNILWDCGVMFRSPVSKRVSMSPLAKATDESPVARGLSTRALLSEMPSPLRFGIARPGRPKLRRYIPVPAALSTKT
ncbi:hypothetical protein ABK675_15280, partial [Hafnia paralvei]